MQIVWEGCIYGGPFLCLFCGLRALPRRGAQGQAILAVVYGDQGTVYGEACAECIQLTPQTLQAQLTDRLTRLRREVTVLETLHRESVRIPSLEDEFEAFNCH